MRIIRSADYRRMTWKNGGGETSQIAISPPGAALDGFDWRISMARVAADGPFSLFPGIDRTLAILDGRGIRLAIAGRAPVDLLADSDPVSFPGDVAAASVLIDGPVTDLNVMTRRGVVTHDMTRHRLDAPLDLAIDARAALLLCHAGSVEVETPDGTVGLGPLDSLLVEDYPRRSWRIAARSPDHDDVPSLLVMIEIRTAGGGTSR
jgi:environmental stress-induced protein Ves